MFCAAAQPHRYRGWDKGKNYLHFWADIGIYSHTVILNRLWRNVYYLNGKELNSCLNNSMEICSCCTNGTADRIGSCNSVQSRWWFSDQSEVKVEWTPSISQERWRLSGTSHEKFLFLCLFSVLLHFLTHLGPIIPDSPWTLNLLYFKNVKTCSWVNTKGQTCKVSSLIFQTPVFSLNFK